MSTKELPLLLMVHQSADLYGSDKVLLLLVEELLRLRVLKPVVIVPEPGPLVDALSALAVEVHVAEVGKVSRSLYSVRGLLGLPGRLLRGIRALDDIVGARKVAVVHSNTLAVLMGAFWSRRRSVRHVWHLHEIVQSPSWVGRGLTTLVRFMSDAAMCNSTKTRDWLVGLQPAMASRAHVVFNGLPAQASPVPTDVQRYRRGLGLPEEALAVSLVGRISRIKGQDVLIEAAALLRREHPSLPLKFLLVGGVGPGQEDLPGRLAARVHDLGLDDVVNFLPYVTDINLVWQATDIAVVPSVEPESFGMVAIEAMAAGRPVVASRQGGLLDIVVDGGTGLLVESGDAAALAEAVAHLAMNADMRREMGAKGQARQQAMFTMEKQAQAALGIYLGGVTGETS